MASGLSSGVPAPEAVAGAREEFEPLRRAIGLLPWTQGYLIFAVKLCSMPLRSAASVLRLTPARASRILHAAIRKLKSPSVEATAAMFERERWPQASGPPVGLRLSGGR